MPTLGRRKKLIQIVINYLVLPMVGSENTAGMRSIPKVFSII